MRHIVASLSPPQPKTENLTTEAQILAEIEVLRGKIPDTQDLYREVSTILFFRYGITPTANKLYSFRATISNRETSVALLQREVQMFEEKVRGMDEELDRLRDQSKTSSG